MQVLDRCLYHPDIQKLLKLDELDVKLLSYQVNAIYLCDDCLNRISNIFQENKSYIELHLRAQIIAQNTPAKKVVWLQKEYFSALSKKFSCMMDQRFGYQEGQPVNLTVSNLETQPVISASTFQTIVNYLTRNCIELTNENIWDIYLLADYHQLERLLSECCSYVRTHLEALGKREVFAFAQKYGMMELKKIVENSFSSFAAYWQFLQQKGSTESPPFINEIIEMNLRSILIEEEINKILGTICDGSPFLKALYLPRTDTHINPKTMDKIVSKLQGLETLDLSAAVLSSEQLLRLCTELKNLRNIGFRFPYMELDKLRALSKQLSEIHTLKLVFRDTYQLPSTIDRFLPSLKNLRRLTIEASASSTYYQSIIGGIDSVASQLEKLTFIFVCYSRGPISQDEQSENKKRLSEIIAKANNLRECRLKIGRLLPENAFIDYPKRISTFNLSTENCHSF